MANSDNSDKIILDLCGGTGAWSRPYKDAGYDVRVITLPEHDVLKTEYGRTPTSASDIFQGEPLKEELI